MACNHDWTGSGPCPDCRREADERKLQRDLAALMCIAPAARLLLTHATTFSHEELAREAYNMAEEFLAEREVNR